MKNAVFLFVAITASVLIIQYVDYRGTHPSASAKLQAQYDEARDSDKARDMQKYIDMQKIKASGYPLTGFESDKEIAHIARWGHTGCFTDEKGC